MELRRREQYLSDYYISEALFLCTVSTALADGKTDRVLKVLDDSSMVHARNIAKQYGNHPGAVYWLWKLRAHAAARAIDAPHDVKEIFERLPKEMPTPSKVFYNPGFE